MSTQQPERVFPGPPAAPSPAAGGAGGGMKMPKLDKKTAMVGGAVVVAALAYFSSRGGSAVADDGTAAGATGYTLDTSTTDAYNELQGATESSNQGVLDAIEGLGDRLDGLSTAVPAPAEAVAAPAPTPPPPAPRPTNNGPRSYTVQAGENLAAVGHKFNTGSQVIYEANKATIRQAAKARGVRNWNDSREIVKGMVLTIP